MGPAASSRTGKINHVPRVAFKGVAVARMKVYNAGSLAISLGIYREKREKLLVVLLSVNNNKALRQINS